MYVILGRFQGSYKKRKKTKLRTQVFIPVFIAAMFVVGFADPNKNSVPSTIELLRQNQPPRPAPPDKKQLSNKPWDYFHPTWMKSTPWTLIAVSEEVDHSIEYSKAELLVEDPQTE